MLLPLALWLVVGVVQNGCLSVTYLANMGVLIEGGGRRVVVDGFHHGALEGYAKVPANTLVALEGARAPYAGIDLILTTHLHGDHFQAASVAARLRSDSTIVFVAARETVDSLMALAPDLDRRRIRAVTPAAERSERLDLNGVTVEVLDLPHGRPFWLPVRIWAPRSKPENVGFLIELAGQKVLHTGDGGSRRGKNYLPHKLADRAVDVAILGYGGVADEAAIIRRVIAPRHVIATHVGPSLATEVRQQVNGGFPGATVFTTPGERWSNCPPR